MENPLFRAENAKPISISIAATCGAYMGVALADFGPWIVGTVPPLVCAAVWWAGGKLAYRATQNYRDLEALRHGACPNCMFIAVGEVTSMDHAKVLYCAACDSGFGLAQVGRRVRVSRLGKIDVASYKDAEGDKS